MGWSMCVERRPRARAVGVPLAILWVVSCGGSGAAWAERLDANWTLILGGRADPRDGRLYSVVPVWQSLAIEAADLKLRGFDDLRIVLRGWGEVRYTYNDPRQA